MKNIIALTLLILCMGCTTVTQTERDILDREMLNERLSYPMADTIPIYVKEF